MATGSREFQIVAALCEIFVFKLFSDLETGIRDHSRSPKAALFDSIVFYSKYVSIYYRFRDIAAY